VAITESSQWLRLARNVIACHHERYDGTGYPQGLAGKDIPLEARIFAIVDVFDALTSERPYKKPIPLPEVLAILDQESGTHFDPDLLARFRILAPKAYAEIAGATEAELQARMRTLIQAGRPSLLADRPVGPHVLSAPGVKA
jgi:HD-GYP domain-containing protein (c-di-GMP phosphodiesterase class II)